MYVSSDKLKLVLILERPKLEMQQNIKKREEGKACLLYLYIALYGIDTVIADKLRLAEIWNDLDIEFIFETCRFRLTVGKTIIVSTNSFFFLFCGVGDARGKQQININLGESQKILLIIIILFYKLLNIKKEKKK